MKGQISAPSTWKYATTRSLVVTVTIVAALVILFACLLQWTWNYLDRPVTEAEKEAAWRAVEAAAEQHSVKKK